MVLVDRSLINGAITETCCFKLGEKIHDIQNYMQSGVQDKVNAAVSVISSPPVVRTRGDEVRTTTTLAAQHTAQGHSRQDRQSLST